MCQLKDLFMFGHFCMHHFDVYSNILFPQFKSEYFVVGFEDAPDYAYLKKLFHDLFERSGFVDDRIFDWDLLVK